MRSRFAVSFLLFFIFGIQNTFGSESEAGSHKFAGRVECENNKDILPKASATLWEMDLLGDNDVKLASVSIDSRGYYDIDACTKNPNTFKFRSFLEFNDVCFDGQNYRAHHLQPNIAQSWILVSENDENDSGAESKSPNLRMSGVHKSHKSYPPMPRPRPHHHRRHHQQPEDQENLSMDTLTNSSDSEVAHVRIAKSYPPMPRPRPHHHRGHERQQQNLLMDSFEDSTEVRTHNLLGSYPPMPRPRPQHHRRHQENLFMDNDADGENQTNYREKRATKNSLPKGNYTFNGKVDCYNKQYQIGFTFSTGTVKLMEYDFIGADDEIAVSKLGSYGEFIVEGYADDGFGFPNVELYLLFENVCYQGDSYKLWYIKPDQYFSLRLYK